MSKESERLAERLDTAVKVGAGVHLDVEATAALSKLVRIVGDLAVLGKDDADVVKRLREADARINNRLRQGDRSPTLYAKGADVIESLAVALSTTVKRLKAAEVQLAALDTALVAANAKLAAYTEPEAP